MNYRYRGLLIEIFRIKRKPLRLKQAENALSWNIFFC